MSKQTPAQQIFDMLVTKNYDPECLSSTGKPVSNPDEAELFSFDFAPESGHNYGTVVIMVGDDNDLQVYFGDNLGKSMEGEDKQAWFDFLYDLKRMATKNLMSFSPKNLNRLKYMMQSQAALKEGLFESWTGTRTQSWNGPATEARLMIRHKKSISEGDARYRYIDSLFIETEEGERYKLPFTKLSGGRAMVEHVRNGGKPYDARGQHIAEIVNELNVLSRFRRANLGKIFEGDTAQLVEQTNTYYESLQSQLKSLSKSRGYTEYFESWNPNIITEEEAVVEGLKHLFVTQSLDERIKDALPLLARIQQQGQAMKEANIFESWVNNLVEGTWATPDSPEKRKQLVLLMSKEFPVGPDATNSTEQLYDLFGDDELFDQLEALAEKDPDADCRQVVYDRMQMLSNHPDVKATLDELQIDPEAAMHPAPATDAGAVADAEQAQTNEEVKDPRTQTEDPENTPQPAYPEYEADLEQILKVAGVPGTPRKAPNYSSSTMVKEDRMLDESGETLNHILDRFKYEVRNFEQGGDLDKDLYDALFDYYLNSGDIPYGVAKARTGDPYEWVAQNLESHLRGGGIIGGNPDEDYQLERESEETDEGVLGTVGGGLAGLALGGPVGGIIGAGLGQAATQGGSGIIEGDDEDSGSSIVPALAAGGLGYAAGSGALDGAVDAIGSALGGAASSAAPAVAGLVAEEPDAVDRMSDLAGIKKKVADEGMLAPLVGAVGGAALGGELASGIGSKFGSEVGSAIGQAAGQEQAGTLGGIVGSMKGSSAGAAAGAEAAKKVGQIGGGVAGLAGGAAVDSIKNNNKDKEETDEGWKGQFAGGTVGSLAGLAAGTAVGGPIGGMIGGAMGGTGGQMLGDKLGGKEETDEGVRGAIAGGALGGAATRSVKGAVAGAKLGSAIQDRFAKKDAVKETTALQGQYGHSGRLQPVAENADFLDRLKELSGMIRN